MIESKSSIISPGELFAKFDSGDACELLDVRTPPEYANAHVPGTRLMPLNELNVENVLSQHKPGRPIYVLCQAGARASKAIEQLERAGCRDGVLVDGGTQAWIDAGLPVHRGAKRVLPLMRQVQIVVGVLSGATAILTLAVNAWFAIVPLLLGCGLLFAGITGKCGMALMLAKMPWNRGQGACSHCCT